MLNAFDSAGDIIAGAVVFLFGGWLAVVLRHVFNVNARTALGLYAWHSLWSAAYLILSFQIGSDSIGYYEISLNIYEPFRVGTLAVTYFTSMFSSILGLSYGATYTIFNIIGFIGLLSFAGALKEIQPGMTPWARKLCLILLLLPGASFWSGSIGKDVFSFMAAGLALWASLRLQKRWLAMAIAVAALVFVRPHIAAVLLAALTGATIIALRGQIAVRVFLTLFTTFVGYFVLQFALEYVGLEAASGAGDFIAYVEERQTLNLDGGSSFDLQGMSIPVRFFTYVYRPLFVDGTDALGLGLSVENLVIMFTTLAAIGYRMAGRRSALPLLSWTLIVLFVGISWALLANTTPNLGIAARQKWMFLPLLLTLCVSYIRPRTVAEARGA